MRGNLVDGDFGARSGGGRDAARVERRHGGRRAQEAPAGELAVRGVEAAGVARALGTREAGPFLARQPHRALHQVRLEVALEREAHVPHRVLRVEQLVLLQLRLGLVLGAREDRLRAQLHT